MYQIIEQQYYEGDINYEHPEERTLPEVYSTLESTNAQLVNLQTQAYENAQARLEFEGYLSPEYDNEWIPDYMLYYRIQEVEIH